MLQQTRRPISKFRMMSIFLLTVPAVLGFSSCKKDEPIQPHVSSVQLSVEDVSCTEAWLKVSFTDVAEPRTVVLMRDGLAVRTVDLGANDTVLEDAGLLPRQTHGYLAVRMNDSVAVDQSGLVQVTTLDTTSHSFTFEVDTLGNGNSSSFLKDVAIISENAVWAVGDMYIRDSTGNTGTAYGFAFWNGTGWQILRYSVVDPSNINVNLRPRGVFAFSSNDVWFAGGGVFHWNGQGISAYWINAFPGNPNPILSPGQTAEKVWGNSSNNLYSVGNQGGIAHYNGSTWQHMESGTTVDLTDVWGTADGSVVWACGSTTSGIESVLLMYDGQSWRTVWSRSGSTVPPYGDEVTSLWMSGNILYLSSNLGIFQQFGLSPFGAPRQLGTISSFPYRIRGSDKNNLFVVGDPGSIRHYNGMTTSVINPGMPTRRLYSVAVQEGLVVAVGAEVGGLVSPALVYRGRR